MKKKLTALLAAAMIAGTVAATATDASDNFRVINPNDFRVMT